jgi:hypothetical protein
MKIGYDNVGRSIMIINAIDDKNFAIIISMVLTGSVRSSSYEPKLNSSEKSLIVTAGITKQKNSGSHEKKSLKSAIPLIKNG